MDTITPNRLDEIAETVNREHAQIETALRDSMARAVNIGALLTEAKQLVRHGEWLPWLAENCTFSERTAQNYMRVAAKYPELSKSATVADMTYREAVGLLAEPKDVHPPADVADWIDVIKWAVKEYEELKALLPGLMKDEPMEEGVTHARRLMAVAQKLVAWDEWYERWHKCIDAHGKAMVNAQNDEIFPMLSNKHQQKVNEWVAWYQSGKPLEEYLGQL